jgi:uncharacterized protein YbjT (DUF2867 family)
MEGNVNVLLFGATGMVGQGVLRECLQDPAVTLVKTAGRTPTGQRHLKLRELVHADMFDYAGVEEELSGFDACYFCIGVTSTGMSEKTYTRLTYALTLAVAEVLARLNPSMVFVYVSGAGVNSNEKGPLMWERVRARTENALLRLPFRAVYIFRPGMIQPMNGVRSKTPAYRIFYSLCKPLLPLLRAFLPDQVLSTPQIGRAMLSVTRRGATKHILESADINALSKQPA